MDQTEFLISKTDFRVIYRALKRSLNENEFQTIEKESAEYLLKDIQSKILHNGTTRKNWQVVKYNDPSWENSSGRTKYTHYGTY